MFDAFTRGRYATDASIYQMMPAGVVVPSCIEDIEAALSAARDEGVCLTMRGGGTSQCGQTVNSGLIIDTSRHLNRIIELDVEARRAKVEPGIVLDDLNRQLKPCGLWFPVDVSTASRATIGGMAANNSSGARSIKGAVSTYHVPPILVSLGYCGAKKPIVISVPGSSSRMTVVVAPIKCRIPSTAMLRFASGSARSYMPVAVCTTPPVNEKGG